jgi:hypothetical protein
MGGRPDRRLGGLLLLCALVQGCTPGWSAKPRGTLEAAWTGADSGFMRGRASVRWCPNGRFAEILGVQGDTGLAIGIRGLDSLATGRYPAVLPDSADTVSASATVALRFLSRTTVSGYQSDSGNVTLERDAAGRLGARFQVRGRVLGSVGRIHLRGTAAELPVAQGGEECQTRGRPPE